MIGAGHTPVPDRDGWYIGRVTGGFDASGVRYSEVALSWTPDRANPESKTFMVRLGPDPTDAEILEAVTEQIDAWWPA